MSRACAAALLALVVPVDALAGCLRLTELLPNPVAADAGYEWVEIYNRCDPANAIDLANFVLRVGHAGVVDDLPLSGSLQGTDRFVVGEGLVAGADLTLPALNLKNGQNETDYVAIVKVSDGSVQDTVVYGSPNLSAWPDDVTSPATSFAPVPGEGEVLARLLDLEDEDDAGLGWTVSTSLSMGRANTFAPSVCDGGVDVKINEINAGNGGQWVELINTGAVARDVSAYQIQSGVDGWVQAQMALPIGTVLQPGETLVVSKAARPFADLVDDRLVVPQVTGTQSGVVRLHRCSGSISDTVVYGDVMNAGGWAEDSNQGCTNPAPGPDPTRSVSRRVDGEDSDVSGDDFVGTPVSTPGEPNLHLETTVAPVAGQLASFTVYNAEPGETVFFAGGFAAGAGPCLPQLGGQCLGITGPRLIGTAVADAAGTAGIDLPVPAQVPPVTAYTQAAIVRGAGGVDSKVTNVNADPL